jgi:hypothetical protein
MLKKPDIPKYFQGSALTEEEKKNFSNVYWSEYLKQLDVLNILTQEEMDEKKAYLGRRENADTETGFKDISTLEEMATYAASQAKNFALNDLIINKSKKK